MWYIIPMKFAVAVFSALSDPLRLRAVALMAKQGELCVCELTHALQVSQPKMSKHLALLREAGLVRDRRDAQWVLYSVPADLPAWVSDVVAATLRGIESDGPHRDDQRRLKGMKQRPARERAA